MYIFASVASLAFVGSGLLLGLFWLLSGDTPFLLFPAMFIAAVVAVGAYVLARQAGSANRQWHPGTYTFADWPLVAGTPTAVRYELRRRNPVADHPELTVQLLLREGGTDAFRTIERRAVDVTRERRIEPITLEFELEIPKSWVQAGTQRRVAVEVSRTSGEFSSAYAIELGVTAQL